MAKGVKTKELMTHLHLLSYVCVADLKVICDYVSSDYLLGRALLYKNNEIDIYTNSWSLPNMTPLGYFVDMTLKVGVTSVSLVRKLLFHTDPHKEFK